MNLRESTGIALGALRANKLRSFLTLLGTIIGVMAVIAVLSIVEGLNRFVAQKLLNAGANVFYVDSYGFVTSQEAFDAVKDNPAVTLDDADALRSGIRNATLVVAMVDRQQRVHFRNKDLRAVDVRGRSPGWEVVDDYTVAQGRNLSDFDDDHSRLTCVVGSEIVDELFPGLDPIGRQLRVGAESYEIVGVRYQ